MKPYIPRLLDAILGPQTSDTGITNFYVSFYATTDDKDEREPLDVSVFYNTTLVARGRFAEGKIEDPSETPQYMIPWVKRASQKTLVADPTLMEFHLLKHPRGSRHGHGWNGGFKVFALVGNLRKPLFTSPSKRWGDSHYFHRKWVWNGSDFELHNLGPSNSKD